MKNKLSGGAAEDSGNENILTHQVGTLAQILGVLILN
jgi:hypothetical protein